MSMRNSSKTLLMTFGAVLALSGCGGGADRVASPGEGSFSPPPTTPPPPTSPPPPPPAAGPAPTCPTGFTDAGVIANLRNCQLPQTIIGNLLVPQRAGTIYSLSGRVDVGQDQGGNVASPTAGAQSGRLTIEPGVRLFGSGGLDYLVVNRGSQLFAEGTATQPIVFTSRQSVEGTTNVDSIGQWGGIVLLGRAPISNCPGTTTPGTPNCEAQVEGTNAFYGGNSATDNTGRIRYVRVQHSGFQILPNNELNGITLAGLGSGTVFEYVQVHNSSDDGFEWFGGTVNAKYLVGTGNDDDTFDTDVGFNGAIQFGVVVQRAGGGDRMNEMSGSNRIPASNPKIANVTYVGRAGGGAGIVMNTSTNSRFYNIVMTRPAGGTGAAQACLDVDDANTTGSFNSVFFSCPTAFDDDANGAAAALFNAGTNNTANGTSTLVNTFINGANENGVTAFANLASISPFFVQVSHIGGVRNASDTWWQGWTCGLTAATPC
ncbi:MAG TPA: hypothetical protein VK325_06140 [Pseudoxanthomonas sp.]|nr:hypothetical protein [Pseudoxanthomonas sp.]